MTYTLTVNKTDGDTISKYGISDEKIYNFFAWLTKKSPSDSLIIQVDGRNRSIYVHEVKSVTVTRE